MLDSLFVAEIQKEFKAPLSEPLKILSSPKNTKQICKQSTRITLLVKINSPIQEFYCEIYWKRQVQTNTFR